MDVVGVPESQNFQISSLPFDYFPDVGLSLAHDPRNPNPANVRVILFDESGFMATSCQFQILPGGHYSKYLWQLPWDGGVPPGFGPIGKVEIESDEVIGGIAMLVTPGGSAGFQISTLPLGGTPLTYDIEFTGTGDIFGDVYTGELTLWIEGFYVKGYLIITSVNGVPVTVAASAEVMTDEDISGPYNRMPILVNGQLIGTELDLSFFTGPANTWPTNSDIYGAIVYLYVSGFTPGGNVNGDDPGEYAVWTAYHAWGDESVVWGTLVIDNTLF